MASLDELAAQFGGSSAPTSGGFQEAPSGVRVPWANLPPAKADEARLRAADYARKKLDANASVVQQGRDILNKMEEFGGLNRQTDTGEWYTSFQPFDFMKGSDEQRMEAITSKIAPGMRIEGSGTTSDRDISMYIKSVPNIKTKGEVNRATREEFQRDFERSQAKLQFLNNYYNTYGHLDGADAIWSKDYAKNYATPPSTGGVQQYKGLTKDKSVVNGRTYLGGDPKDPNSWSEKR